MKKFLIIIIFLMLIVPGFSFAAQNPPGGLIPCDGTKTGPGGECNFGKLMDLVNNIINIILYGFALPIAAIMFTYAGFKLVISAGSSEARTSAKSIFWNAVIGLALAGAAWLIIKLILTLLGYNGAWIGF